MELFFTYPSHPTLPMWWATDISGRFGQKSMVYLPSVSMQGIMKKNILSEIYIVRTKNINETKIQDIGR